MKNIKILKYPLRWLFQILFISYIIIFVINVFNGNIIWDNPNDNYTLYFVLICFIEFISIIYLLRNKTYYIVDKIGDKYIINKSQLTCKEYENESQRFIVDHYRYDNKTIDLLNTIDILFSLPSNKMIQKQIKNKVLTYPKYQIKTVSKIFSILGMKYYKLELKNGKKKYLFVFNNL